MDKKVTEYMEKQKSPQKEICQKLRGIIFRTVPEIKEQMKWGVPNYGNDKYYIVSLKTHVNLGFSLKDLSEDQIARLEGSGKTMKHIKIKALEDIDEKKIVKLLKMQGKA